MNICECRPSDREEIIQITLQMVEPVSIRYKGKPRSAGSQPARSGRNPGNSCGARLENLAYAIT